jgi:hypothetical protein
MTSHAFGNSIVLAACVGALSLSGGSAQDLVVEKSDQGALVLEGKDSVLFFQVADQSYQGAYIRSDYIHPLWSLDGEVLTEDFPDDHLHHRGIFWAWHQVYVGDKRMGDMWECRDFNWDVKRIDLVGSDERSIVLAAETEWSSPAYTSKRGRPVVFLLELATIRIFRKEKYYRVVDIGLQLFPMAEDVAIGGSEDEKGYGGFSVRLRTPDGLRFATGSGDVEPQTLQLEAGPWMDISGPLGRFGRNAGVVVIGHRDNPGHPQPWILRAKDSMQNPVYPGSEPVRVPQGDGLVLRYRLVIHSGTLNAQQIQEFYRDFNAQY